jgi:glutamate-1-semialdehyde 2,1-aminomutase
MGDVSAPNSVPTSAGTPRSRLAETVIAPFNEPEMVEQILARHDGEFAAIIVEPVQFNIGVVPPNPGFLERLRELATQHGAVLIFDEVKTGVVIAYGGATEYYGVQPDLFCLAKSIGGGTPIGAFGGRDEVMRVIEGGAKAPLMESAMTHSSFGDTGRVAHMGTMNGSPLVMAAALAILTKVLTPDVYPRLHAMGDRLTAGSQAIVDEFGLPGYAVNVGPKGIVMFAPQRVTNYRDFIGLDEELWTSSFYFLANRGILIPPAPDDQWTLSVQHTDDELDRYLAVFRDWAAEVTAEGTLS